MSQSPQDVGRNVARRPTTRVSALLARLELFREAKIDQFRNAAVFHREHHIFRLQVTVDDSLAVQELQRHQCDRAVVDHVRHDVLVERTNLGQERAALDIFKFEVQVLLVLKG